MPVLILPVVVEVRTVTRRGSCESISRETVISHAGRLSVGARIKILFGDSDAGCAASREEPDYVAMLHDIKRPCTLQRIDRCPNGADTPDAIASDGRTGERGHVDIATCQQAGLDTLGGQDIG